MEVGREQFQGESETESESDQPARKRGRPEGCTRKVTTTEEVELKRKGKRKPLPLEVVCSVYCCSMLCLSNIAREQISVIRENYQKLSVNERSMFILDWLYAHSSEIGGLYTFVYSIGTIKVCYMAWLIALGCPQSTFHSVKRLFRRGIQHIGKSGNCEGRVSPATQEAVVWLKTFADSFGDKLPDCHKIHLPMCMTKEGIYDLLVEEVGTVISLSHFLKIWRENVSFVTIPKTTRFSKCDKCILFKMKISEAKDKELKNSIKQKRERHLLKQNTERQKYYKHVNKAKRMPNKYVSLILDGMDQNKTMLPHAHMLSKTMASLWKLKIHLTGAIVHGIGSYGFFDYCQFPHGSNLTITVIVNILNMMKDDLPETLYLQMDNCGRENKNRFVLGFLCHLVEKKIFRKIKVSFLMVGHTHEDIDRLFSRFSNWLNRHSARTLDALIEGWQRCQTPSPTGIKLEHVFNASGWLDPFLETISYHSFPHCFKITVENKKAVLKWKNWSTDQEWKNCVNSETLTLLKDVTGKPDLMEPDFNCLEIDRLENDILKSQVFFTVTERKWWEEFFQELNEMDFTNMESHWCLPLVENGPVPNKENEKVDMVEELEDDDDKHPPVKFGTRKTKTVEKSNAIKEGDFCLVDLAKYVGEWPQMGQIKAIHKETVVILWYKGNITTPWKPCKHRVNGMLVPWHEEVAIQAIYSYGFQLTPSNVLKKCTRKIIDEYTSY